MCAEAKLWRVALGYPLPREPDVASNFIQLITPTGDVQVIIQRVHHEARAHLDIESDSIDSEVLRMEHLGATVSSCKNGWVVMQAPTGHRFCEPRRRAQSAMARRLCRLTSTASPIGCFQHLDDLRTVKVRAFRISCSIDKSRRRLAGHLTTPKAGSPSG